MDPVRSDFDNKLTSSEVVVQRRSVKKMLLKISQNSQENTCARVFFNKLQGCLIFIFYQKYFLL